MLDTEYQYFINEFFALPSFCIGDKEYEPFVSPSNNRWGLSYPDIFWHICSASKVRDCTDFSPIFPCCNTTFCRSCGGYEVDEYQKKTGRKLCPYRSNTIHCVVEILQSLSKGDYSGVRIAEPPYENGRYVLYIRKMVGPLDYFIVFKKLKPKEDDPNNRIPLMLITSFPLAYRQMITRLDGQLQKYATLIPEKGFSEPAPHSNLLHAI